MAYDKNAKGEWKTIKGTHVFIPEGSRLSQVLKSKFKLQGGSKESYNKKEAKLRETEDKLLSSWKGASAPINQRRAKSIEKQHAGLRKQREAMEFGSTTPRPVRKDLQKYFGKTETPNWRDKDIQPMQTKGLQNALPQRTAPKGELSGAEATNALNKLEAGMPVMVKYGKDFEPKQAIYLGRNDDGRFAFYDGGGVTGRFDFGEQWLKDNPNVSFNFEDNDPIEWNRLNQEIKGNTENKPLKNFNEGWNDEDKKDYMKIPQEERVKAYEEGKNWKDLVKERREAEFGKQIDEAYNKFHGKTDKEIAEQIASERGERILTDEEQKQREIEFMKNLEKGIEPRRSKEAYNNSEWLKKQGHDIQLEKKLEKFKPSGDIEKDTRRLEDISSNYFYDEVGIYNENIEEVCKEWARDSARKINATKETMNSTPKRLGSWRINENGKKEYYERELGDDEPGYWTKENGQRVFKENPNYKPVNKSKESNNNVISYKDVANEMKNAKTYEDLRKALKKIQNKELRKDVKWYIDDGENYDDPISKTYDAIMNESNLNKMIKSGANNVEEIHKEPNLTEFSKNYKISKSASNRLDDDEDFNEWVGLYEDKAQIDYKKQGGNLKNSDDYDNFLKYAYLKHGGDYSTEQHEESSWSRKMRENKAKTVDEREKNLRDTLKIVKLRKKINEQAKRKKK